MNKDEAKEKVAFEEFFKGFKLELIPNPDDPEKKNKKARFVDIKFVMAEPLTLRSEKLSLARTDLRCLFSIQFIYIFSLLTFVFLCIRHELPRKLVEEEAYAALANVAQGSVTRGHDPLILYINVNQRVDVNVILEQIM